MHSAPEPIPGTIGTVDKTPTESSLEEPTETRQMILQPAGTDEPTDDGQMILLDDAINSSDSPSLALYSLVLYMAIVLLAIYV